MIRVAALTSGKNTPSARYRVRQHIPLLGESNINVDEYNPYIEKYTPIPDKYRIFCKKHQLDYEKWWIRLKKMDRISGYISSKFYNMVWLERVMIPKYKSFELRLKHPMIFDADDAIWLDEGFGFTNEIAKYADIIFAGNSYIADWFSQYNKNVVVVPTAIDISKHKPHENFKRNKFIIGWTGLSSNFFYLKLIEKPLKKFLDKFKDSYLSIISDAYPQNLEIPKDQIIFNKWSQETDFEFIKSFVVGVMPLKNDEWTKGKCSFKMLQYMAAAKPVIVSPFGMNKQILNEIECGIGAISDDDWFNALELIYKNEVLYNLYGQNGLNLIKEKYCLEIVNKTISENIKELY